MYVIILLTVSLSREILLSDCTFRARLVERADLLLQLYTRLSQTALCGCGTCYWCAIKISMM